ncbi:hypothetical protein [Crossiella cryophila]|uniref:Uncharacterized protein n=1 Tax=Crossiella cryophila TaxID=43355 RepID=A0A7W7CL33_9PSEU|nr:hypothetical protein [Crossiella cryophila]MBB4681753.1 hypothetical protein [Crossiella cryophila]
MSRTAAHIRSTRARTPHHRAWHAVAVSDLRYSTAAHTEARHQGRRVRPIALRRAVAIYSYPRMHNGNREIARLARIAERRARQDLRRALTTVLREINTPGRRHPGAPAEADIPPIRHRHGARWHAW